MNKEPNQNVQPGKGKDPKETLERTKKGRKKTFPGKETSGVKDKGVQKGRGGKGKTTNQHDSTERWATSQGIEKEKKVNWSGPVGLKRSTWGKLNPSEREKTRQ